MGVRMSERTKPFIPSQERRVTMRRSEDIARSQYFSIPQVMLICAFVAALASLAGWTLNIEIRKADRSEIIGVAYRQALDQRLENIETELRYIRVRVDQHMQGETIPKANNVR